MKNIKISWQSSFHFRLPIQKDLFILDNNKIQNLSEYLIKSKGIKVIDDYSHINGCTSSSNVHTAEIPEDIKELIFRIEDIGDFINKKIFSKVFFQSNINNMLKNDVIDIITSQNNKSRHSFYPLQIEVFELTIH
jgi:hypothetical protein